jgi:hypothetical protein
MRHETLDVEAGVGERGWFRDGRPAVKVFRYARDPFCLVACGLYAVNRFWFRHLQLHPFLSGQFDDLLLIPCALPLVLWLQRRIGLRDDDSFPGLIEIGFHLAVWSIIAEGVGPRVFPWTTADWKDVAAYSVGALISTLWWRYRAHADLPPQKYQVERHTIPR